MQTWGRWGALGFGCEGVGCACGVGRWRSDAEGLGCTLSPVIDEVSRGVQDY